LFKGEFERLFFLPHPGSVPPAEWVQNPLSYLYRISILNCGDSMTEERQHAILFAATILLARKLLPTLEEETPDLAIEHYQWRAIHQASRIVEKIDERWPTEQKPKVSHCEKSV
jgi:hypothetical protein